MSTGDIGGCQDFYVVGRPYELLTGSLVLANLSCFWASSCNEGVEVLGTE